MIIKKNFGIRILSLALVLLLVLSLIPTSVMATDTDKPWLDSSVTATKDGITLYIPEVYCNDCGENVQDAELVIDSVDYAVGIFRVKYHLGRHLCFEISTKSNTISIDDFDCTTEYNEYPVYANAWDQTTSEPVAYLSREAGHVFDEGESGICAFCGETVQTGWVYDSGNWYYYYEDGTMATDTIISNEYGSYYVGSDGVMVVNQKVMVDDVWYQAAEDGTLEPLGFDNRWELDSDNWYYYYEDGTMATDTIISNENGSYYFGSDGALVVNQKVQVDGVWYQAAEDGRLEPLETDTHNYVNGICSDCGEYLPATDENEDGVFEISNAGQLYWFAEYVNTGNTSANAILTADIVVNEGVMSAESTDARAWTTIGNADYMYTGTFDGNNKTVSGLYFNNTDTEYVGLFGRTGENGTVKNTGVINSYFNGYNSVGGVVGSNHGKITNCYNTGDVSGNNYVGGLVGDNPSGTIIDCYNTGDVSGNNYVGGLVGYNPSGTIIDCYNTGDVSGAHDTGGLVGYNPGGTIANCYNTGAVSGTEDIGGLVGYNSGGTIANCYNTGAVSGTEYIGGLVGYNPGGTIANCYNTGAVSGTEYIGGLVGYNPRGTITNCYYLDTACTGGIDGSDSAGSAEAKTAEQFANGEVAYLLQGEQEEEIWGQKIGTDTAPVLGGDKVYYGYTSCADDATAVYTNNSSAPADKPDHNFVNGFCTVCDTFEPAVLNDNGTPDDAWDDYYEISNAGQLYWFAAVVNEGYGAVAQNAEVHAKLMADIIVNEGPLTYNTADARVWIPIGKCQSASYGGPGEGVAFKGTFDGNGFTISGLYHPYSKEMYDYAGFIGCLQGDNSQVKDLGIINCFIESRYIAAGIVGTNDGGTVENCYVTGTISTGAHGAGIAGKNTGTVTECYNDALINGLSFGGGIVAFNEGTVSKCYNIGDCRFDTGGGIAYQSTGLVEECYNVVDLSFSRHGAGIVWNGTGEVICCYNTGNISSPLFKVCGVAGVADKIIDCYNTGDISGDTAFGVGSSYTLVKNCYNTGRITAKSYAVGACPTGGIVTSENCYYLEGMVTAAGTVDVDVQGESEAKSAEAFTSGEVAYLLQNNREEQIWGQKLGEENTPQFSENKVYKNQIGGCKEENFVYEYSNTQEDAVTTHPGEWIIDASWSPESSESCYVYIDVYCNDCGDYLDYTSCEAELISEEAPTNCQNPGKREWSCTFTVSDRTFTETYTEVLRNDVHTDLNDDGFCTACGGYEKPEVDPGEDLEWDYDDVYLIYNAGQLYWFAEHVNNVNNGICGKLMADIDLNPGFTFKSDGSYSFGGIEGPFDGRIIGLEPPRMWTPIGSGALCYAGNFDGNGFVVSGAYAVSENYYVGLFGNTDYNYEIKNLGISNSYFEGSAYVGGLVGYAYTYIQNCYVTDTVYVNGGSNTAALVGYNGVEIWNSYAMSDTLTDGGWGSLYNCYYLADEEIHNEDGLTFKTAEQFESGEVAYLLQSGIVGEEIWDDELGEYVQTEPEHIWGQRIGEDTYPVFGGDKVYTVKNCKDEVAGYSNTEGKTLDHTFENGFCTLCDVFEPATDENEDGVFEISNAGQLYWFAEFVNAGNTSADAILTDNIVVNEGVMTSMSTAARVWTPIGKETCQYAGTFNGNGKTISGLYFNDDVIYVGLFGCVLRATVKDLGVINSYLNGKYFVGGVVGYNYSGTIINCYNTSTVSGMSDVGGVAGFNYGGGTVYGGIFNCYNTGKVLSTHTDMVVTGGVLGNNQGAIINNCYYLDTACTGGIYGEDVEGSAEAKTAEQFASGEVAYLLQGEQTEEIWGQKIGTDELPTLGGDKVYAVKNCIDEVVSYNNTEEKILDHDFENGFCTLCGEYQSATDENNDGVYEIGNAGQLYWFAEYVNAGNVSANAVLTADIVVNEGTVTESSTDARVWTPIGNWSNKYTGTFDGNDYTVSGLYFNDSEAHYVGLFGVIGENGAVKNTGIINSYFNGDECVGGVSGYNFGTVTNCYSTAKISADRFAGGIVGCSYGIVANSYNTGKVNGNNSVSGVVGVSQYGTIINCYNTGEVSGTNNVGGILGESYSATIANCYNTGTVDGNHYFGAIFGNGRNEDASNCYYLDSSCRFGTGSDSIYGPITSIAKTSGAFASGEVAYLLGDAFGQKIGTDELPTIGGDKVYYGYLSCADDATAEYTNNSNAVAEKGHNFVNGFCVFCDVIEPATDENNDGVYEIANAGQLYWFADKVNNDNANFGSANAILTADIVVNEGVMTAESEGARAWTPIGNFNSKYSGSFDGNNKTVSGLYLNESSKWYVGLFGFVYNGTVKNTGVINSYFCGRNDVGAIAGVCNSGEIINCYNESIVVGDSYTGGVAGYNQDSTMTDCYNSGNVSGNYRIAGVVGFNQRSIISNTYNTGVIGTGECVGGIVGESNGGAIESCYNAGEIIGRDTYRVGGIIGENRNGSVDNCYNIGTVDGTDSMFVGGIAGNNIEGTITNCYYLNTACEGGIDGSNLAGSAEAKTAEQFKSGEVAYLLQGEQTEDVWGQKIGTDELPTIGGDKVYYGYASCADDVAGYTNNSNVLAERPDHNFVDGSCTACGVNALFYAERTVDYDGDVSDESKYFMQLDDALRYAEKSTEYGTYYSDYATVKLLSNNTIGEDATVNVPSNVTLDLNGFELTNNGTINFESIDGFKASGGNYTGEGTVKIGEYDGIIFENTLYYFGGEYTPDTNVKRDLAKEKDRICFVAGEGYAIYTNADGAVLNLYNATIHSNKEGVGDSSTVAVYYSGEDTLTVNFYGENNLYSEADLCVMGIETLGALVLNGMGDNPVLNINGEEAESYTYGIMGNDITVNSGTINVIVSNAGTDSSNGIVSSQNLTVANGAVLNLVAGDANSISAGIILNGNLTNNGTISAQFGKAMLSTGVLLYTGEEPMGTGTINAIVLGLTNADGENPVLKYYTSGEAIVYTYFSPATEIAKSEFLVSEGSTLVIREDAVADLTLLSEEDITIEGEVAVDGSILLPEGISVLDIKDNLTSPTDDGTVCIGENGYYYFENGNLKCGNEESHFTAEDSENVANCKHKAVCDICGAEYGDTNDNHIGEIIPKFDWDNPYDGECYVYVEFYCTECGSYVDSASGYAALKETVEAEDCMHDGSELYEVSFEYESVTYKDTKNFTLKSDNHTAIDANGFCSECGGFEAAKYNEETGVYEISNAGQLYWYAQKLNEENAEIYAKLINDIVIPEDAPNWTPINCSYAYFDGNFKTISGLKCVGGESDNYVGLFGMEGWWYEISNLHITDSYFEGKFYVGAVVAWMTNGGSVTNCCVTNTTVKGDSYNVGTLVGKLSTGNVINCYVDTDSLIGYYNDSYCTVENNYYLADTDDGEGGKTAEQFASGEVAYLLQSGVEGEDIYDDDYNYIETIIPEIWGQRIGEDTYPVFGGDKVYQVENCIGDPAYSNANENGQHNFVNGFCTICGDMDGIAQVKGYSIGLGGNITVNYYMVLSDEVLADENAEMVFTVPNGDSTYEVRIPVSSVTPDVNGYYVFTCEVAAKEMASKIAAQIVTSDKESDVFEYSVKQYAEYILAKAEEANKFVGGGVAGGIVGGDGASNLLTPEMLSYVSAAPLVKAMLNYGANAQLYFNHNTDILANATLDEADKDLVDTLDLSEYNASVTGSEEGVAFYGGALSLKSETAIKLYFVVDEGTAIPEVSVNGKAYELTKNGTLYEIKISDIPAHKLSEMYEVKVGGLTLNYGAFSYGYQAMNTGKETLVNTIKALYAYNQKAVEYLG